MVYWRQKKRILLAILLIGVWLLQIKYRPIPVFQPSGSEYVTINFILDAGHGGEDGGAVSVTGVPESSINLDIVLRLSDLMSFLGESSSLLREEDISLHDETAKTLREKKVSDLKNRVKVANQLNTATLLSIHQNTYTESKYHGTQVFYAPTNGSQELAEILQTSISSHLQPTNTRQVKQIPETVYLMNHISNRAVLVECGFLTNPEEEAMLRSNTYQKKFVMVLSDALCFQN